MLPLQNCCARTLTRSVSPVPSVRNPSQVNSPTTLVICTRKRIKIPRASNILPLANHTHEHHTNPDNSATIHCIFWDSFT